MIFHLCFTLRLIAVIRVTVYSSFFCVITVTNCSSSSYFIAIVAAVSYL